MCDLCTTPGFMPITGQLSQSWSHPEMPAELVKMQLGFTPEHLSYTFLCIFLFIHLVVNSSGGCDTWSRPSTKGMDVELKRQQHFLTPGLYSLGEGSFEVACKFSFVPSSPGSLAHAATGRERPIRPSSTEWCRGGGSSGLGHRQLLTLRTQVFATRTCFHAFLY